MFTPRRKACSQSRFRSDVVSRPGAKRHRPAAECWGSRDLSSLPRGRSSWRPRRLCAGVGAAACAYHRNEPLPVHGAVREVTGRRQRCFSQSLRVKPCRSAVTDAALRAATDLKPWGSWSCRLWLDNAEGRPGYRRGVCAFAKCARACEMAPPGAELRNRPPRLCSSHPDARYSIESVQPNITT
jgi:hypothetical protein